MKKKWLALLLAAAMVTGLLAGCGKKDSSDTPNEPNNQTEQDNKENNDSQGSQDAQTPSEGGDNTASASDGTVLPISDEKVNFSMWVVWSNSYMTTPDECIAVQELEKQTNVHIDYVVVNSQEASEKFGLMIASGDVPDMVRQATSYYPSGIKKAIDDGIFMDVTDAIKANMPNYLALVQTHPEALKGYVADDGSMPVVWGLNGDDNGLASQKTYLGLLIRQDWLDDCGLKMPETIEDWHTTLTAFKEQKGAEAPLMIGPEGTIYAGAFTSAFGIMPEFYAEDGVVKYGPAEMGYKDFLETFRQWYEEGLIDPNFTANNSKVIADNSYMATGKAGAGNSLFIYGGKFFLNTGMSTDENINYVGAPIPVMNAGDTPRSCYNGSRITGESIAFAPSISNLELALKWLDYQYTEEAMALCNYGIEGETYTLNEGGTPKYQYTDQILKNPDGYSPSDALLFYCPRIAPGRYDWQYEEQFYSEDVLAIEDVWSQADRSWLIAPEVTMTEEEGNIYNSSYTDIQTLVDEMTVKFILGSESLDDYSSFIDTLYTYGLQKCLDVQQAAYDRYQAR